MLKVLSSAGSEEERNTVQEVSIRANIYCYEQKVGRSRNVKGIAGKDSEENKEHVTGNRKKGNTCCIVVIESRIYKE